MTQKIQTVDFKAKSRVRPRLTVVPMLRDCVLVAYLAVVLTGRLEVLEGSIYSQISVSTFFGVSILLLVTSHTPVRRVFIAAIPLYPMLFWILLSVSWSEFQDFSIRRALRLLIETSSIIFFASIYRDQYRLLRVIYIACALVIVTDTALLSAPSISFSPIGYVGAHDSKQSTGIFCMMALPLFLMAIVDRRIFPNRFISLALSLSSLLVLALSLSKSAIALTPVCLLMTLGFLLIKKSNPIVVFVTAIAFACGALVLGAYIATAGMDTFLNEVAGDSSLTGRDMIWYHALSLFAQAPLIGQGYGGIWNLGTYSILQLPEMSEAFVLGSAHNGYIDILAESGIMGLVLAIGFMLTTFYRIWLRQSYEHLQRIHIIALYTFIAVVLENFFESSIFRSGIGSWSYFLLVAFAAIFFTTPVRARTKATK